MMDRRTSIKTFLTLTAGVTFLPSCFQEKEKSSILLKNMKIDSREEELVALLSETILPATDTPGAKDLSSHLFVLMMVDECFSREEREKFVKGLKEFRQLTKSKYDKSFRDMSATERRQFVQQIETKEGIPEDVLPFYAITKRLTIQSYTTSPHYVTKIQVYKLVPGKFSGCVPVSPQKAIVQ